MKTLELVNLTRDLPPNGSCSRGAGIMSALLTPQMYAVESSRLDGERYGTTDVPDTPLIRLFRVHMTA